MKKRKILVLFPFLGLLLSGCSVEGVMAKAKDILSQYIYQPIKGLIDGGSKEDDSGKDKPAEKTLSSIAVTKHPDKVKVGEAIDKNEVKLTLTYSDESKEENVAAEEVVCDTSKAAKGVEATAKYKDKTATFKIDVVEDKPSVNPEHAGTEQDPYSSADAVLVASALSKGEATEASYYIKGEVESFEEVFNAQYGNYSFKLKDGFIGWRLKYGPNYAKFNEGDLEVGDTVTLYAQIQAFGDELKPETKGGYITKIEKKAIDAKLESISIEGEPAKEYLAGTAYNHDGLKVVGHYDNGQTQDLTLGATWGISKETAEVGDESITISATYGDFKASLVVAVTVQDSSKPQHAGTAEDPYTGLDAVIVASKLEKDKATEDSFYIKGKVVSFEESFNPSFGNFSFKIEGGFIGWRLKNGPEFAPFNEHDIEVDDVVLMYAQIQAYGEALKPETKGGYVVSVEKAEANEVVEIIKDSAKGIPDSVIQTGSLDKSKITIDVKYKDGHTGTVNPDKVVLDTSVAGKNVEGKLVVGKLEYTFTIEVIEKVVPQGEVTVKKTIVEVAEANKWENSKQYLSFNLDDNITVAAAGKSNTGKFYTNGNEWRIYQNESPTVTISAGSLTIKKVTIEYNISNTGIMLVGDEQVASGSEVEVNASSFAFTVGNTKGDVANGQVKVTSIEVVYQGSEPLPVVDVTSVEVTPKNLELDVSDASAQLSATVLPEVATDKSVTWSSSDENVAKVSAEGLVTPVASGNAVITAKAGDKTAECAVKVTTKVQSVEITETLNLVAGSEGNVYVSILPANADDLTYTLISSNEEVATVDEKGLVTAKAEGQATITVKTNDGEKTDTCLVTVSALEIPVESVELECEETIEMKIGDKLTLKAHGMPENATKDRAVEWALHDSDSEILTVYSDGRIEALKEGTVTVRATSVSNSEAHADVTVTVSKVAVESVELNKDTLTLTVDESETLVATVSPDNATDKTVVWSSSNKEVATVDQDGLVTAIAQGEATITAEADGKSATCVVTVEEAAPEKGTAENPYTVAEARAAIDAGEGVEGVYATGIVTSIAYNYANGSMSFYFSDDGTKTNELEAYKLASENDPDVIPGDTVVVTGNLTKYNSTYEFAQNCTLASHTKVEVSSIEISGTLTKSVYNVDEEYSEAGLTATAHLANGNDYNVTSKVAWEASKQTAEEGDESVEFTASYRGVESLAYACAVSVSTGENPQETQVYKLDGTITGGSSGYAEASEIEQGGVKWDVVGNTTMNPWRIGGKNLSGVDRTVTCKAAFSDDITKVVVSTGTKNLSAVNSITLLVGTTQGASDVDSIQLTSDLVNKDLEYARPEGHSWANCYFTIVFNVNAASSNQYIQLKAVTLYAMK